MADSDLPEWPQDRYSFMEWCNRLLQLIKQKFIRGYGVRVQKTPSAQVLALAEAKPFYGKLAGSSGTGTSPYQVAAEVEPTTGAVIQSFTNLRAVEFNGTAGLGGRTEWLIPGIGGDYRFYDPKGCPSLFHVYSCATNPSCSLYLPSQWGSPLAGITVTFTKGGFSETVTTDEDGKAEFSTFAGKGWYGVTIENPPTGYSSVAFRSEPSIQGETNAIFIGCAPFAVTLSVDTDGGYDGYICAVYGGCEGDPLTKPMRKTLHLTDGEESGVPLYFFPSVLLPPSPLITCTPWGWSGGYSWTTTSCVPQWNAADHAQIPSCTTQGDVTYQVRYTLLPPQAVTAMGGRTTWTLGISVISPDITSPYSDAAYPKFRCDPGYNVTGKTASPCGTFSLTFTAYGPAGRVPTWPCATPVPTGPIVITA